MHDLVLPFMDEARIFTVTRAFPLQPHCHPVFEFHYVHTGDLTWEIEGRTHMTVRGGDIAVIQPDTPHRSANDAETPSVSLSMSIPQNPPSPSSPFTTREEQAEALRILRRNGNRIVHGNPELDVAFCALRREARRIVCGNGKTTTSHRGDGDELYALSIPDATLLRNLLHQCFLRMQSSLAAPCRVPHYAAVNRVIRAMNRNIAEKMSLSDLARVAGVSRSRLTALFHAQTGKNPAEYLMRLRLDRGMLMLRNSSLSVTGVADALGFASSQHFARCFHKYFGLSPTEWRRGKRAEGFQPSPTKTVITEH